MDSTPHTWYMQLLRKFTSSTISYFIGPAATGMKPDWLSSIPVPVLPSPLSFPHLFFTLCLSCWPAPCSDLNTNRTRPDPEGESSPPKTDNSQKMESPAKKDTDRRLATPTKSDAIPRSPGSPASPVPRSKRKEGKGKCKFTLWSTYAACIEFSVLKGKPIMEGEFGLTWSSSYNGAIMSAGVRSALLRQRNASASER